MILYVQDHEQQHIAQHLAKHVFHAQCTHVKKSSSLTRRGPLSAADTHWQMVFRPGAAHLWRSIIWKSQNFQLKVYKRKQQQLFQNSCQNCTRSMSFSMLMAKTFLQRKGSLRKQYYISLWLGHNQYSCHYKSTGDDKNVNCKKKKKNHTMFTNTNILP